MRALFTTVLCLTLGLSSTAAVAGEEVVAIEGAAPVVTAMTFDQACCVLKDLGPGMHKVTFIHPYTCCPVDVCFCLPCGCYCLDCKCGCFSDKIVFDYPGLFNNVVIKFKKNGSVVVND